MDPGICRSCQAEILWVQQHGGERKHPVEKAHRVGYTEDGHLVKIHESHFAHCPNSAQHRARVAKNA